MYRNFGRQNNTCSAQLMVNEKKRSKSATTLKLLPEAFFGNCIQNSFLLHLFIFIFPQSTFKLPANRKHEKGISESVFSVSFYKALFNWTVQVTYNLVIAWNVIKFKRKEIKRKQINILLYEVGTGRYDLTRRFVHNNLVSRLVLGIM